MHNVLNKISKVTKTDADYLFRNGTALVGTQIVTSGVALILSVLFARYVSKDTFGLFQYIITIGEVIALISLTGIGTSLIRSATSDKDGTLLYSFKKSLLWSTGVFLLGLIIALYYFINEDPILAAGALAAAFFVPIINSSKLYVDYLTGKKFFIKRGWLNILGITVPALGLIFVITRNTEVKVIHLILAYFCFHALINLLIFGWVNRSRANDEIDQSTISYAKHLSVMNLITRGAGYIDKIAIFHFVGALALAEYIFAINVPRQFQHIFKNIRSLVLPKVSQREYSILKKTLPRKILLLYIAIIPITVGYIYAAPYIYELAFPLYSESVVLSQWYSLLFLLMPINVLNDALVGHVKKKELYITKTTVSITKIILTVLLCSQFGVWGVLWSILLAQTLNSILLIVHFFRAS